MKKLIAILLVLVMAMGLVACAPADNSGNGGEAKFDPAKKSDGVLKYADYIAAADQTEVTIEAFVQAKQGWWDNKITIYAQDPDGGYFLYNMQCSEEDAAKLVPGTHIRAKGSKTTWEGEVEIMEGTLEILTDGTWIAETTDVTSLLAAGEGLDAHQNKKVAFKGMTVEACDDMGSAYKYGWDGSGSADSDSDLYFNASYEGVTYTFVIEYYLTGPESTAYQAVQALQVGDVIDLEGFMYWYAGVQPHITSVTVK